MVRWQYIIWLVLGMCLATVTRAGDYFLDGTQKSDLILHGRMAA